MDLSYGPEYEVFRDELRAFIAANRHLAPVAGGPRDEKGLGPQRPGSRSQQSCGKLRQGHT